ncbi:MAG: hypothetical protein L0170_09150 [Acidobacteria bacterium]|nr:hypothetical protein [Acidobacteriota bacterium]
MAIHVRPRLHRCKEDRPRVDSPMPAGFFRTLRSRTSGYPELRLAGAVLEDAAHTFRRNRGAVEFHRRLLYWEVEQWFASRSLEPVFSFERVCLMLGLEADEIRRLLQRWATNRLDGPVPMLLEWTQPRPKRPHLRLVTRT